MMMHQEEIAAENTTLKCIHCEYDKQEAIQYYASSFLNLEAIQYYASPFLILIGMMMHQAYRNEE